MIINYTNSTGDYVITNVISICFSIDMEEIAYTTMYDIETKFLSLLDNTITSIIQNE